MLFCSLWLSDKTYTDILSPEPIPDFRDTVHSPALHHSPFSPMAGKCQKMLSQQMLLISLSEAVPFFVPSPIALCPCSPSFHLYTRRSSAATSLQAPFLGHLFIIGQFCPPHPMTRRDQCFNRLPLGKSLAEDLSLNGQVSFRKICLIVLPPRAAGNPFSELRLIQLKNNFVVQRPILYGIITGISCNHQDCLEGKKTLSM